MEIKKIDIKEFREKGYLQELNRTFLHPLGLALEIVVDDNGVETLGGIWDSRDEKEGIYYNLKDSDEARLSKFRENEEFITGEMDRRTAVRRMILGFGIEEIPSVTN